MAKISSQEWDDINKVVLSVFQHFSRPTYDENGGPILYPANYLRAAWDGLVDRICGPGAARANIHLKDFFRSVNVQRNGDVTPHKLTFDVAGYLKATKFDVTIARYQIKVLEKPGTDRYCGMLDLRGVTFTSGLISWPQPIMPRLVAQPRVIDDCIIYDKKTGKSFAPSGQPSIKSMFAQCASAALPAPAVIPPVPMSVASAEVGGGRCSVSPKLSDSERSALSPPPDRSPFESSAEELTEEQLARIARNRQAALALRAQKEGELALQSSRLAQPETSMQDLPSPVSPSGGAKRKRHAGDSSSPSSSSGDNVREKSRVREDGSSLQISAETQALVDLRLSFFSSSSSRALPSSPSHAHQMWKAVTSLSRPRILFFSRDESGGVRSLRNPVISQPAEPKNLLNADDPRSVQGRRALFSFTRE